MPKIRQIVPFISLVIWGTSAASTDNQEKASIDHKDKSKGRTLSQEDRHLVGDEIPVLKEFVVTDEPMDSVKRVLADPYLTLSGEARAKRLIKEHIETADLILNRYTLPFFGISLEARAEAKKRELERIQFEQDGQRWNELMRGRNQAEYEAYREEYYDTLYLLRGAFRYFD